MGPTWWSRQRVQGCFYASAFLTLIGVLGSYSAWLARGCIAWCPFVSDLSVVDGIPFFAMGTTPAAILVCFLGMDHYLVLRHSFHKENSIFLMRMMFSAFHVVGLLCCICIIGIAQYPWNTHPNVHEICVAGLFFAGILFGVPAVAVGWQHRHHYRSSIVLALLAIASAGARCFFFALADISVPTSFMRDHLRQHCHGPDGSLHSAKNMNASAFCEWCFLTTLMLHAFLRLRWDLSAWPLSPRQLSMIDAA